MFGFFVCVSTNFFALKLSYYRLAIIFAYCIFLRIAFFIDVQLLISVSAFIKNRLFIVKNSRFLHVTELVYIIFYFQNFSLPTFYFCSYTFRVFIYKVALFLDKLYSYKKDIYTVWFVMSFSIYNNNNDNIFN